MIALLDRYRALAPLKRRAFRWLWLGVVITSVGAWAQTVGAQWLFVHDPNAATIVALVQTASTLPMMLLALPAGVLADAFDRRWLLAGVQSYFVAVATCLTVLTALGRMPPALLLGFTLAVGAGQAMLGPTWQALITELVPRREITAATRLDMVSVNVARAAGPAIAGFVIARWGVPPVFGLTAVCATVLVLIVLAWRRPRVQHAEREPFFPALVAGGRYVRHEPVVRRILFRLAFFMVPGCALWALLPLIASRLLNVEADGYGIMFAALGLGAVIGALGLGRVKAHVSSNGVLGLSAGTFAAALALLTLVPNFGLALVLLMVCGFGWTATVATIISELQLFLPGWVRARAIGIYLMVFLGAQALASPVWGLATQRFGLRPTLLVAAGLVAISVFLGLLVAVPENDAVDRTPITWDAPQLMGEPEPDAGPVVIAVEYEVMPEREREFLAAMSAMRRSRRRSGATRWDLYRVGESPGVFVEQFHVATWREHQRQHDGRLTVEDQAIEDAAFAHVLGAPRTRHLLPPSVARDDLVERPAEPVDATAD